MRVALVFPKFDYSWRQPIPRLDRVAPILKRPGFSAGVIAFAIQFYLMHRMTDGNLFNAYPYLSDDGFDWINQGLSLKQLFTDGDWSEWPVLRNPFFVLLTASDQFLTSGTGGVIILCQSIAVFTTTYVLSSYAKKMGFGWISSVSVGIAWYLSFFGFFHMWILSDTIASCFMIVSVVTAVDSYDRLNSEPLNGSFKSAMLTILPAVLWASLAGLTQTYGIIPIITISATYVVMSGFKASHLHVVCAAIAAIVVSVMLVFGIKFIWELVIPHGVTPTQFGLIKLNLNMLDFYLAVWPLAFGALLPTLFLSFGVMWRENVPITTRQLALLSVCGAFATMGLVYQWEDSRFTFIYIPVIWATLLSFCALEQNGKQRFSERATGAITAGLAASIIMTLLSGVVISPENGWNPGQGLKIAYEDNWISAAIERTPMDRFSLSEKCANQVIVCPEATYAEPWSPYTIKIFEVYDRRIKSEFDSSDLSENMEGAEATQ